VSDTSTIPRAECQHDALSNKYRVINTPLRVYFRASDSRSDVERMYEVQGISQAFLALAAGHRAPDVPSDADDNL